MRRCFFLVTRQHLVYFHSFTLLFKKKYLDTQKKKEKKKAFFFCTMSLKGEERINHSLTIVYSPFFFNNIFKIFFVPFLLLLNCLVVSYFSLKKVKITPSSSLVIGTTWKLRSFFFSFFFFFFLST